MAIPRVVALPVAPSVVLAAALSVARVVALAVAAQLPSGGPARALMGNGKAEVPHLLRFPGGLHLPLDHRRQLPHGQPLRSGEPLLLGERGRDAAEQADLLGLEHPGLPEEADQRQLAEALLGADHLLDAALSQPDDLPGVVGHPHETKWPEELLLPQHRQSLPQRPVHPHAQPQDAPEGSILCLHLRSERVVMAGGGKLGPIGGSLCDHQTSLRPTIASRVSTPKA